MLGMLAPMLAAAAASSPLPADVADVRCIAVFSTLAGDGVPNVTLTEEQKSGLTTLIMYYVGKLEGRGSGINIELALLRELAHEDALDRLVREDLPRCGKETDAQGATLSELGKRLETFGK